MKILVVEDNPTNLKLVSLIIKSMGHEVITASDGEEGVNVARESAPHLILMDIQMPRMDGISALKLIRDDRNMADIAVIALTSFAMQGDREKLLEEGFNDYISKPISKDNFVKTVERALEKVSQAGKVTNSGGNVLS